MNTTLTEAAPNWWDIPPVKQFGPLRRAMGYPLRYTTLTTLPQGDYSPINGGPWGMYPPHNTPRLISYEAYLWQFKKPVCHDFDMPHGSMFSPATSPAYDAGRDMAVVTDRYPLPQRIGKRAAGFSSDGRTYDTPKKGQKKGVRRCVVRLKGRDCPTAFLIGTNIKEGHIIRPPVLHAAVYTKPGRGQGKKVLISPAVYSNAWRPQGVAQSLLGTRKHKAPNYHWAATKPTYGKGRVIGTIQKGIRDRGKSSLLKWGESDSEFWKKIEK